MRQRNACLATDDRPALEQAVAGLRSGFDVADALHQALNHQTTHHIDADIEAGELLQQQSQQAAWPASIAPRRSSSSRSAGSRAMALMQL